MTIAPAVVSITPGLHPDDPYLTKSKTSESLYLNCAFHISEGIHLNRRVFEMIGVQGNDYWVEKGRMLMCRMLESAHGIGPKDQSESAKKLRSISNYGDLNGLSVVIQVGVAKDKSGQYADKNCIKAILTTDDPAYHLIFKLNQQAETEEQQRERAVRQSCADYDIGAGDGPDCIPF
jgi:hypothetical protein